MPTDAPSNLPPVLRPDAPPVHSLDDLAARFGAGVRGDTAGVTLTGLTLATADLRPATCSSPSAARTATAPSSPPPPPRRAPSPS